MFVEVDIRRVETSELLGTVAGLNLKSESWGKCGLLALSQTSELYDLQP